MAGGEWSRENGKKGGRPRLEATKLREAIIRKAEESADALADVLRDKALTGDVPALKEIFDRGLGKAHQTVDMGVEDRREVPMDPNVEKLAREYDEKLKKLLTK